MTPASTSLPSRSDSVFRATFSDRWNSSKRVKPCIASRTISSVHESPNTSTERAKEHGHSANSRFTQSTLATELQDAHRPAHNLGDLRTRLKSLASASAWRAEQP